MPPWIVWALAGLAGIGGGVWLKGRQSQANEAAGTPSRAARARSASLGAAGLPGEATSESDQNADQQPDMSALLEALLAQLEQAKGQYTSYAPVPGGTAQYWLPPVPGGAGPAATAGSPDTSGAPVGVIGIGDVAAGAYQNYSPGSAGAIDITGSTYVGSPYGSPPPAYGTPSPPSFQGGYPAPAPNPPPVFSGVGGPRGV